MTQGELNNALFRGVTLLFAAGTFVNKMIEKKFSNIGFELIMMAVIISIASFLLGVEFGKRFEKDKK